MFWVYVLCSCFVWANGYLREMELPVYSPPSQDLILSKYFRGRTREPANRNKKSIVDDSEKFQKAIEFMKNDITFLKREMFSKNAIEIERKKPLTQIGKVTRLKARKQSSLIPAETTTYRYPTATYSVEKYEKSVKRSRSKAPSEPSPILRPPLFAFEAPKNNVKTKRGSTKWKNANDFPDYRKIREEESDFVDKFLEEALMRYLISSDLQHGNVSVKTFTEILKNITQSKPAPRKFSLYDENRESRIKFRKEFSSRKKNETKPNGLLEKRLQRRLERMQISNGNKTVAHFRKYSTVGPPPKATEENGKILPTEAYATTAETTTTEIFFDSVTESTTERTDEQNVFRNTSSEPTTTVETIRVSTEKSIAAKNESELKLSVAETVYYRKRHFPVRSLIVELDKTGVIPGVPEVDYPMYSYPPATGFKCPSMKGQRPKMMADVEARCQVFYICTGDGPAAAMLCPNGTMFNENVLVCDWWYNVDC